MSSLAIVFRKEIREILRDRRTLIAIGLAVLATPTVLFVISQVSTRTATQTYTVGYSGDIPAGLDVLFGATGLRLERVDDPAAAAKRQVDIGIVFTPAGIDEYYDPTRQTALPAIASMRGAPAQLKLGGRGGSPSPVALTPLAAIVMVWPAVLLAASFTPGPTAPGPRAHTFRRGQPYAPPLYSIPISPASIV